MNTHTEGTMTIKAVTMHTNAGQADRTVYCVISPTGRVIAERMTRAGAERAVILHERLSHCPTCGLR